MEFFKNAWKSFRQQKLWVQVLIGFVALSIIGALAGSGSSTDSGTSSTTTSSSGTETKENKNNAVAIPTADPTADAKAVANFKAAYSRLRIKKDSVTNKTWFYARSTTSYVDVNSFHLYMGRESGSDPYLRWKIQYAGEDWLFIKKFVFNVDGVVTTYDDVYGDMERDNDSSVWEWYDVVPSDSDLALIKSIADSKKAIYRSEGDQYYKDRTITETEKKALRDMLTVYYGLIKGLDKIK